MCAVEFLSRTACGRALVVFVNCMIWGVSCLISAATGGQMYPPMTLSARSHIYSLWCEPIIDRYLEWWDGPEHCRQKAEAYFEGFIR